MEGIAIEIVQGSAPHTPPHLLAACCPHMPVMLCLRMLGVGLLRIEREFGITY